MKIIETGYYRITTKSTTGLYGSIYIGTFNPSNRTANLLANTVNTCTDSQFNLIEYLHVNTTYLLVVSTIYEDAITKNFTIIVYSFNSVTFHLISKYLCYLLMIHEMTTKKYSIGKVSGSRI